MRAARLQESVVADGGIIHSKELSVAHVSSESGRPRWLVLSVGGLIAFLAGMVLVGWHVGSPVLVQMHPVFRPMRYNAALGLLAAGLALLALAWERRHAVQALGVFAVLCGLGNLLEYFGAASVGLDRLGWVPRHLQVYVGMPPDPVGALGAVMFGAALLLLTMRIDSICVPFSVGLLGITQMVSAVLCMVGILAGHVLAAGPAMARSSLVQLVGLSAGGVTFLLMGVWHARIRQVGLQRSFPVGVAVIGIVASAILWQALSEQERRRLQRAIQFEANNVAEALKEKTPAQVLALLRAGMQALKKGDAGEAPEIPEASLFFMGRHPGWLGLAWVSPDGQLHWRANPNKETRVGARVLIDDEERAKVLAQLRAGAGLRVTAEPASWSSGGRPLLLGYWRIPGGQDEGALLAVFRLQELLDTVVNPNIAPGYAVSLSEGNRLLYVRLAADRQHERAWGQEANLALFDFAWRLKVWPTPEVMAREQFSWPKVVLIVGNILAALLALAVYLAQTARARARALEKEIHDRRKIEETLAQERYLLHALMNNAPDRIHFKDAQGRFTSVSQAMVQHLGLSHAEEMLGKTDQDFFGADYAQLAHTDEWAVMRTGLPLVGREEKVPHPDGATRWLLTTRVPFRDKEGNICGTIGISRDITERKRAEEELHKAKEAAESASRAKSQFLANMSHEIRTPMNGILGMTELALDAAVNPEQREYLAMVKSSADSLMTIINDVLDFSKIEAGKFDLDSRAFSLREVLEKALKPLAVRAYQKGLEMVWQVGDDVPDGLVGDPGRLRQVLVNLAGNAIKFTGHGEVVIRVFRRPCEGSDIDLRFAVSDTGIGIPADKHKVIFNAFEQADGSTTRKYGGTGLGLAIVSSLVDMMGGELWLESEVNRGTTFHFTVRLGTGKPSATGVNPVPPPSLAGLRVLVVDDSAACRDVLEQQLRHWHMEPTTAASGAAALRLIRDTAKPFHVVLIDAQMSGVDGFAVARQLLSQPAASKVLMILSSPDRQAELVQCRQLGVTSYCSKPLTSAELLQAVVAALAEDSTPSDGVPQNGATAHSEPQAAVRLRVLLAEDNPVNQKLVSRLLARQSHSVVVVANGLEALAAFERQAFDLVLMDVQMPYMGGLEAAGRIREMEQRTGRRAPIIALTAHALSGDRERCLQAGMDDHLTKPVQAEELDQILAVHVPGFQPRSTQDARRDASIDAPSAAENPASQADVFDREDLLDRLEGDAQLLQEISSLFLANSSSQLEDIRAALEEGDLPRLVQTTHAFKGTVSNFAAPRAYAAAKRLEAVARGSNLAQGADAFHALKQEVVRLRAVLEPIVGRGLQTASS